MATGAGYGFITTLGDAVQVQEFVSSGTTPEEQQLADWLDGPRLYAHFPDLPRVLRLWDLANYVRSLGYGADQMRSKTFQGTPMPHQGVQVVNSFPLRNGT